MRLIKRQTICPGRHTIETAAGAPWCGVGWCTTLKANAIAWLDDDSPDLARVPRTLVVVPVNGEAPTERVKFVCRYAAGEHLLVFEVF